MSAQVINRSVATSPFVRFLRARTTVSVQRRARTQPSHYRACRPHSGKALAVLGLYGKPVAIFASTAIENAGIFHSLKSRPRRALTSQTGLSWRFSCVAQLRDAQVIDRANCGGPPDENDPQGTMDRAHPFARAQRGSEISRT
jgi:hypothetical protein